MFGTKSGFTLIELLVVITLIGISITLVTPSWDRASQKRRVTNAAEQAASFLALAQGEAQKRNQPVSLSFSRSADQQWCIGAVASAGGCDCTETDTSSARYCALDGVASSVQAADHPFLNLIDAQRVLLEFELEQQRALASREQALAQIELLVGRPILEP